MRTVMRKEEEGWRRGAGARAHGARRAHLHTLPLSNAPVGGRTFLTNMKTACSGVTLMRLRMTYTNWPTVRSDGTRYLALSMSGMADLSAFSTMT